VTRAKDCLVVLGDAATLTRATRGHESGSGGGTAVAALVADAAERKLVRSEATIRRGLATLRPAEGESLGAPPPPLLGEALRFEALQLIPAAPEKRPPSPPTRREAREPGAAGAKEAKDVGNLAGQKKGSGAAAAWDEEIERDGHWGESWEAPGEEAPDLLNYQVMDEFTLRETIKRSKARLGEDCGSSEKSDDSNIEKSSGEEVIPSTAVRRQVRMRRAASESEVFRPSTYPCLAWRGRGFHLGNSRLLPGLREAKQTAAQLRARTARPLKS